MFAVLVPLLLAAAQAEVPAPAPVVDPAVIQRGAIEQAFVGMFSPYAGSPTVPPPWEVPIYSAEVTALIAEWRAVASQDEPDALSMGDWLCQCQDWDQRGFAATITSMDLMTADSAALAVTIDPGMPGTDSLRQERLALKREGDAWKVDDIVAESFPAGLKQALREMIAAGRARAGERG